MSRAGHALLLVEGHAAVRAALADALRRLERVEAVLVARTLDEAVQLAHAHRPHAALYDPRTVAGEAEEALRQLGAAGLPVVILTSSLREGEAEALRRAGAVGVVLKGTPLPALLALIETVVGG